MLTMVNSEHQASATATPAAMASADAFHQQYSATTSAGPQHQQQTVNDENAEPRQRNIPVQVLVRHEELASNSSAGTTFRNSGEQQSAEENAGSLRVYTKISVAPPTSNSSQDSKRPREKRSTKSKCPPGLRSGKWTPEEEMFTNLIIHYFKLGRLNVEDGTSLRWYLAKRLNCEAMRVTKKLKGNSSIGKQIFRALEDTEENRRLIEEAADELAVVEKAFLDSLTAGQQMNNNPPVVNTAALTAAARINKRASPHKPSTLLVPPRLDTNKLVIPKIRNSLANSEDAKLLLHFFVEAQDSTTNAVNVEKKRLFSEVDSSPSTTSSQSTESPSDAKRRAVDMDDLMDRMTV